MDNHEKKENIMKEKLKYHGEGKRNLNIDSKMREKKKGNYKIDTEKSEF